MHFGAGVQELEALIEASRAKAFVSTKVKEAAEPFSNFAIPEKELKRRREEAEREAAERAERKKQEAKWCAEEEAERRALEAEQKAKAEAAEKEAQERAKKAKAAFTPQQIEALRAMVGNAGELPL
ncbi:hypothetical protein [Chelativorans xinjiangense]|uniref:hypothetical protein n=1 Tax=Chelativorans xinjiangense TaxID=2681485 RepID=UPI00135B81CB|nr:hypothetical protein [Chelativorans xinjiangense]